MGKTRKLWVAVCAIMAVLVWLPFVGINVHADPGAMHEDTVTVEAGDDVILKPNFDVLSRYGVTETTPDLTYKWYIWGENSDDLTDSTYERKNVVKSFYCDLFIYSESFDKGYFRYGFNVVVANGFNVKAIGDTEITAKPGETVTFKVQASCDKGDITYDWQGQGSVSEDDPAEFTTDVITKGCYVSCRVSDMYGNIKTIDYNIKIENGLKAGVKGSSNVNVPYNEKATLEVEASCNKGEIEYVWYDADNNEQLGSGAVFTTGIITEKKNYRCRVSDEYGNYEFVYFAVNIDNGFKVEAVGSTNVIIKQGESVTLKVKASCIEGELTYKWTGSGVGDDEAATDSITVTYNSNSEISYSTYTCEVTDKYGNSEKISFTVGSYNPSDMSDTSKVYVISWNEEVKNVLEAMLNKRSDLKGRIAFINLEMGGTDPDYLKGIDLVLEKNPDATFIVAGDASVLGDINAQNKYMTVAELGLTSAYSAAYPYTRKAGTLGGKLTAMTWQANPGIFMYDPDIAQKVLGTSDPEQVQKMIGTADGFLSVAAKMKAAGYYMTSGAANKPSYGDQYYEMLANMAGISVFSDDYGLTDSQKEVAKKIMYGIVANGYDTGHTMWESKWIDDTKSGKVFGWFSCTWAAMWSLTFDKPMAVCQGPVPYYWGGTYLFAKSGKADKTAAEILKVVCCDAETMAYISESGGTFPNNAVAAQKLIKNVKSPVSMKNNQNLWEAYDKMARAIDGGNYRITEPAKTPLVPVGSNGIVKGTDGVYYYVKNGAVQTGTTGMIASGGKTYYVSKGVWQSKAAGLKKVGSKTYYISGGLLQSGKTGFVKNGSKKYYVIKGVVQSGKTGFVKIGSRKYYVAKGVFQGSKTGFVKIGSKKYYVVKGIFQSSKTGFVKISGKKYYVVKGVFQSAKTGLVKPVKTGKTYYIKKGVLQSKFTGRIVYKKHTYKIVKGVMTKKIK